MVCAASGVLVMLRQPFVRSRHFFSFCDDRTLAGTAAAVTRQWHAGPGSEGWCKSISVSFFLPALVGHVAFLGSWRAGQGHTWAETASFEGFYSLMLCATAGRGADSAQE